MNNAHAGYFKPGKISFWRWEDKMDVIAGTGKHTICYRTDLINVLRGTAPGGLPTLGNILLCLSACHEGETSEKLSELSVRKMQETSDFMPGENDEAARMLLGYMNAAIKFMNLIRGLPVEWRSGNGRIHLINELFAGSKNKIKHGIATEVIDQFATGNWDYVIKDDLIEARYPFYQDITDLLQINGRFTNSSALLQKLKTGATFIPEPIEEPLPITKKEEDNRNLFEQLADDTKTSTLALLAENMIAALNIPIHAADPSDMSFGGVSDISNRGNFDKLLVSELANDDTTLMARLVNNEALYLRREAPPVNVNHERNILVDTTIKMWGTPRFYSIAAALACAHSHHHVNAINAFTLNATSSKAIDLTTKNGVVESLTCIDPGLHCCEALLDFVQQPLAQGNTENIFITSADIFGYPLYQKHQEQIQQTLDFLITVTRQGELDLYEFNNGHRKLLNKAKFNLEELQRTKKPAPKKIQHSDGTIPAFYNQQVLPLLYPAYQLSFNNGTFFTLGTEGHIVVNDQQRVLHWSIMNKGATQLLPQIEYGKYCGGSNSKGAAHLMVYNNQFQHLKIYHIRLTNGYNECFDLSKKYEDIQKAVYHKGTFYLQMPSKCICIDADTGILSNHVVTIEAFEKYLSEYKKTQPTLSYIKRLTNNGYSVGNNIDSVGVYGEGALFINKFKLGKPYSRNTHLSFKEFRMAKMLEIKAQGIKTFVSPNHPNMVFTQTTWPDGSTLTKDGNGILHLCSSDPRIPEISIAHIYGKATAVWASNGVVAGAAYFFNPHSNNKVVHTEDFYEYYLEPFGKHIVDSCT
ncbi:MAG TPA: hypothetical protein PLW44_07080 [Chitinophagales bacterium]|nr:hypothetical protein [Chitinophagales bacterium]